MDVSAIPLELKQKPQWVVWRKKKVEGRDKPTKVPYQPNEPSVMAEPNNPETWSDLETAIDTYAAYPGRFNGLGFVFVKDNQLTFIDLDGGLKDGKLSDRHRAIVNQIDSYTELSPSGTGVHIYALGNIEGDGINTKDIEIYDHHRFATITGDVFESRRILKPGGAYLANLYQKYKRPDKPDNVVDMEQVKASIADPNVVERFLADPACKAIWDKLVSHPSQSEYDMAIASAAVHRGYSDADIVSLIRENRIKWGNNPEKLSKHPTYVQDTLTRARTSPPSSAIQLSAKTAELHKEYATKPYFVDMFDLLKKPRPLEWLVQGYIAKKGVFWFFGKDSAFKSFIVLHLCAHVMHGMDWCGKHTKKKTVLYLCGEGEDGIQRRCAAIQLGMKRKFPQGGFIMHSTGLLLNEPAEFNYFMYEMDKAGLDVGLVVIDTKSTHMQGSDSDDAEVGSLIRAARKLQHTHECAVVMIDHTGYGDDTRARGSSKQSRDIDGSFLVERPDPELMRSTMSVHKPFKDGPKEAPISWEAEVVDLPPGYADEYGDYGASLYVTPKESTIKESADIKNLGAKATQARDVLREMYREYRDNIAKSGNPDRVARVERAEWRKRCLDAGIKANTFHSIPDKLRERNIVRFDDNDKHIYLIEEI